ncbi:MAG: transposase [Bacillota bacterium]
MWVKFTKTKAGDKTRTYVQQVESYRDDRGKPRQRVLTNLGRQEQLDPEMVARLSDGVAVISEPEEFRSSGARVYGSTYVLEQLWTRLGLGQWWRQLGGQRRYGFDLEAAVRALVFCRLHHPRPALEHWMVSALGSLADVDTSLCLFDTTSIYFEGEGPAELARFGFSRDRRSDCRQFILGLLSSREGLPIGHLVLPGNTADVESLARAHAKLLERIPALEPLMVTEHLARLRARGCSYIVGVRLRQHKSRQALARPGRYTQVADNLRVKEVSLAGATDRFIVCYNPEQVERDRRAREQMVTQLRQALEGGQNLSRRLLRSAPARRYLKVQGAQVKLDEERIKADAAYDGKWVLQTNVDRKRMPPREVARHYKGLWRIESAFRSMKSLLETHPVYHWTERRVKAHAGVGAGFHLVAAPGTAAGAGGR